MPTCLKILTGVSIAIDVQNEIRKAFCLIVVAFNLAKSLGLVEKQGAWRNHVDPSRLAQE